MEKVKTFFKNLSFRSSLILHVSVASVIALLLILVTTTFCQSRISDIKNNYSFDTGMYTITNEEGEIVSPYADTAIFVALDNAALTEQDRISVAALDILSFLCIPVFLIVCITIAAKLFYRNKMDIPLTILENASSRISYNDLDFAIEYDSEDEMGKLCVSFEKMRGALAENNIQMWRQVEQRKRLNAAFAHDLRTPLTVLKGYREILEQTDDPQIKCTVSTMSKHINRIERYVDSMSNLQKIEDMEPEYRNIPLKEMLQSIEQTIKFICGDEGKTICFHSAVTSASVVVDENLIMRVVENIASNAVRYTGKNINVNIMEDDEFITVSMQDDGPGFSDESVQYATDPYYSTDPDRESHFGLGLYICKILCLHHGGDIQISNHSCGAEVTATFRKKDNE